MAPLLKLFKVIFVLPIALVFAVLVVAVIVLSYFPLLILCMIYKGIVVSLSKFVIPDSKCLGPLESLLANGKVYTDKGMYVSLNMIFEGRMNFENFKKDWEEKTIKVKHPSGKLKYPELQCYVETFMGYSFYRQDKSFDLKNHFKLYDNNDQPIDRIKFNKIRNELIKSMFPAKRSPWEIIIINNYQHDDDDTDHRKEYSIVVFKYHHCLADGFATLKLFYGMEDIDIKPLTSPKLNAKNFLQNSFQLLVAFFHVVFLLGEIPFFLIYSPSDRVFDINPWHKPIKSKDLELVLCSVKPFDTNVIKEISRANKVSMSSVLMAACSGGFRRMMEAKCLKSPKSMYTVLSFNLPNPPEGLRMHSFGVRFKIPIAGGYRTCKEKLSIFNNNSNLRMRLGATVLAPLVSLMLKYLPVSFSGQHNAKLMHTMNFSSVPLPSTTITLSKCSLVGSYVSYEMTEFNTSFAASCLKLKNEFFVTCGIQRELLSCEEEAYDIEKYIFEELRSLSSATFSV